MHDYFTLRQQRSADDWRLANFARQYTGISFDRDLSPRHSDLVGEHVNVAIRLGAVKGGHLIAHRICWEEQALFAAPAYLDLRGLPQ